ncbi:MAG: copper-binding protein [Burkholderiaceae bacterium]|nr:copper-binding protein [Burkholderiaceae bacterium]
MKSSTPFALAASLLIAAAWPLAAAAAAQSAPAHVMDSADMTSGEVKKIDKEAGKLTLKHGDIKNLDMPGMTMVFTVKDKTLLDPLKTGDKVKFMAISEGGKLVVTAIQPIK